MRVAFCVSGRGGLFRAAVNNASAIGIEPALLVTETSAAADLDEFARVNGIRSVRLDPGDRAAFDRLMFDVLVETEPELVALTFDRILPATLVARFPRRIVNVHPSLLPAFSGTRAIERTVGGGVRFGGATIHEVINDVDAGPIVAQAVVPTQPDDTPESYGRRLYQVLEPMFLSVLGWYAADRIRHDEHGRPIVRDARYGATPISPEPD